MPGGFLLFSRVAFFPLAYNFSEGAGSVEALVSLSGAHLVLQAFGKSRAAAVAAVPATGKAALRTNARRLFRCPITGRKKGRMNRPFFRIDPQGAAQKP